MTCLCGYPSRYARCSRCGRTTGMVVASGAMYSRADSRLVDHHSLGVNVSGYQADRLDAQSDVWGVSNAFWQLAQDLRTVQVTLTLLGQTIRRVAPQLPDDDYRFVKTIDKSVYEIALAETEYWRLER